MTEKLLSFQEITEMIKSIRKTCDRKHNMSRPGFCAICGVAWIGKEEYESIKKLMVLEDE